MKILNIIAVISLAGAAIFGLQYAGWLSYTYWAPKWEDNRLAKVEQTPTYIRSINRDLEILRLDYLKSTSEPHKNALKETVLYKAPFDTSKLSPTLRTFIHNLKRN